MKHLYAVFALGFACLAIGQNPVVDATFNAQDAVYLQNIGREGTLLPNGQLLTFKHFESSATTTILRLNADGSPDNSFNFTPFEDYNFSLDQHSIHVRADGKFVLLFDQHVTIHNADGSLDATFAEPLLENGSESYIHPVSALYQDDGKVMLIGDFQSVNGSTAKRIVRLNADGSVDTSFNSGSGFTSTGYCSTASIARQSDGKYVVGGEFSSYNGTAKRRVARLNADGSVDTGFTVTSSGTMDSPQNGFTQDIKEIVIQPNGKILVCGGYLMNNGNTFSRDVSRLNADGSRDTTFQCLLSFGSYNGLSRDIILQPDGKIIVFGWNKIVRISATGSQDNTFSYTNPDHNLFDTPIRNNMDLAADGKIYVHGHYRSSTGITRTGICRITATGALDMTFNPSSGTNTFGNYAWGINSNDYDDRAFPMHDQKVVIAGLFTSYNDVPVRPIIRVNADGTLDTSFNLDPSVTLYGNKLLIREQPDGKILVARKFLTETIFVDGNSQNLIRLNENGSLDTSFNFPNQYQSMEFHDIKFQSTGKIVMCGEYNLFQNPDEAGLLVRLNTDGSIDNTFTSYTLYDSQYQSITMLADDTMFITEDDGFGDTGAKRIAANGSLITWSPPNGSGYPYAIKQISGDKFLMATEMLNGDYRITKINLDGTVDNSMAVIESTLDERLYPIGQTSEGKILIRGTASFGTGHDLHLFLANGQHDISFGDPFPYYYDLSQVFMQDCDNIFISGFFDQPSGSVKHNLARYNLMGAGTPSPIAPVGEEEQTFAPGSELSDIVLEGDNITWYSEQNNCATFGFTPGPNATEALPPDTLLVSGETYYASQTVNGVESTYRLPVKVYINLSVQGHDIQGLQAYPNPVRNNLYVRAAGTLDAVEIINVVGSSVAKYQIGAQQTTLDFSAYKAGIYFVKVQSEGKTQTLKVVRN